MNWPLIFIAHTHSNHMMTLAIGYALCKLFKLDAAIEIYSMYLLLVVRLS